MEINDVAQKIEKYIDLLSKGRSELQERSKNRAYSIAEYEKTLAMTLIKLKNGVMMTLDTEQILLPPASTAEKIARGIVWKEKLALEQNEGEYKNAIAGMRALESQLNGWQSIFRHLSQV